FFNVLACVRQISIPKPTPVGFQRNCDILSHHLEQNQPARFRIFQITFHGCLDNGARKTHIHSGQHDRRQDRSHLMTDVTTANNLFFTPTGMDRGKVEKEVRSALANADDGELYLEYRQSEGFSFDDGRLKSASFDTMQGFGLRAVVGEATGFAHASELSERAIRNAAETVKAVQSGKSGVMSLPAARANRPLYGDENPLSEIPFDVKVKTLAEIDAYARARDSRVVQVSASLAGSWQAIEIIRAGGERTGDIRPLV